MITNTTKNFFSLQLMVIKTEACILTLSLLLRHMCPGPIFLKCCHEIYTSLLDKERRWDIYVTVVFYCETNVSHQEFKNIDPIEFKNIGLGHMCPSRSERVKKTTFIHMYEINISIYMFP